MQFNPVKTRVLQPPHDDLFSVLDEYLHDVKDGDIIAVSSKVVSIHEGNCVSLTDVDKHALLEQEADLMIPRSYWGTPLTIKYNAFIGTAGIDESNADGHYILLPKDPFKSAADIHGYLVNRFQLTNVGVLITDSHSVPMRRGALGVSIGYFGFEPTINYVGTPDLFGREMKIEVANIVDALASGAGVVMGETDECQPVVVIRDVPNVSFSNDTPREYFMVPYEEDTFRVLYEDFLDKKD
jgi:F420-0:gamma-glutamyl ligase